MEVLKLISGIMTEKSVLNMLKFLRRNNEVSNMFISHVASIRYDMYHTLTVSYSVDRYSNLNHIIR